MTIIAKWVMSLTSFFYEDIFDLLMATILGNSLHVSPRLSQTTWLAIFQGNNLFNILEFSANINISIEKKIGFKYTFEAKTSAKSF